MNVYCYLKAIQLANSELEFVEQFIELIEEIMQEHIESLNYDDFHPSITMSMIPEQLFDYNPVLTLHLTAKLNAMIETSDSLNSDRICDVFEIACELLSHKSKDFKRNEMISRVAKETFSQRINGEIRVKVLMNLLNEKDRLKATKLTEFTEEEDLRVLVSNLTLANFITIFASTSVFEHFVKELPGVTQSIFQYVKQSTPLNKHETNSSSSGLSSDNDVFKETARLGPQLADSDEVRCLVLKFLLFEDFDKFKFLWLNHPSVFRENDFFNLFEWVEISQNIECFV